MLFIYTEHGIVETLPPRVLGMPAKTLMMIFLIFDALTLIVFSCNLSGFIIFIFLLVILVDIASCSIYVKSSFRAIFVHLFFNIGYIVLVIIAFAFLYCNPRFCFPSNRHCKQLSEYISDDVKYISTRWFYLFIVITLITHIAICSMSWEILKYVAARNELEKLSKTKRNAEDPQKLNF